MTGLVILIPAALFLGGLGLGAFLWSLKSGQYEDLKGAAHRMLLDDSDNTSNPQRAAVIPERNMSRGVPASPEGGSA